MVYYNSLDLSFSFFLSLNRSNFDLCFEMTLCECTHKNLFECNENQSSYQVTQAELTIIVFFTFFCFIQEQDYRHLFFHFFVLNFCCLSIRFIYLYFKNFPLQNLKQLASDSNLY
jgi:hypothetical protein